MSSGGDLDGDEYFVCWDKDIVPSNVARSYEYPPNKEYTSKQIKRLDLARHFASYSGAGVARIASLHAKWVRASEQGALSAECQELNALHSQCVDGASIRIPDRLTNPPDRPDREPYILELLEAERTKFADEFHKDISFGEAMNINDAEEAQSLLAALLQSHQSAVSEYELFNLALLVARKHKLDLVPFLTYLDMSALTAQEKHAISATLGLYMLPPRHHNFIWNSLIRSDILTPRDLYQRDLMRPFSIQRLYSSKDQGLSTFFEFLQRATQEFTRKLLILRTDDRFAIGIFIRGEIPWGEDPTVDENVVVCSFLPNTASSLSGYRPCTVGYRLHVSDTHFQLYDRHIGNTFVFINRRPSAGAEVAASIALQKISATVQRQIQRIRNTPVISIELHVVSNRDRVAHELFDLWFEHVHTERILPRFPRQASPYIFNDLRLVDWTLPENRVLLPSFFPRAFNLPPRADNLNSFGPPLGSAPISPSYEQHSPLTMNEHLSTKSDPEIDTIMKFAFKYHAEDEMFLIFDYVLTREPISLEMLKAWMEMSPLLAFTLLKRFSPHDDGSLSTSVEAVGYDICRNVIRCANSLGIAALVALEKMSKVIAEIDIEQYCDLLMLAALSVRSRQLVQEVLLVLNDCRLNAPSGPISPAAKYGCKLALAVAFDHAEEAGEECPCDDSGKPRKQRSPPSHVKLSFVVGDPDHIRVVVRIDAPSAVRLHSHVRLQASSKPKNRWLQAPVLDGIVVAAKKGELTIETMHTPPPEMESMDWNMYNAGITATSKAMMDAILRLLKDGAASCRYHSIITGENIGEIEPSDVVDISASDVVSSSGGDHLNPSQVEAVKSSTASLSLIWGPPGTGKTTVVVNILQNILKRSADNKFPKILMTASTHNAVDNVLERFVAVNEERKLLPEQQILRVATDQSKVNENFKHYTVDARVGGDTNEDNHLAKKAQERVKAAVIVFSTCAGAGLGTLRKADFDVVIIDEASQVTEPCALIPLVKGAKQAILVGDHVQLRPTVRKMGTALEYDVSLMERLWLRVDDINLHKTMLDVQYRSPAELMAFPSKEFYGDKLKSGLTNTDQLLGVLSRTAFSWPSRNNAVIPTLFVQCSHEEDMGGMSKSNLGQIDVIERLVALISTEKEAAETSSSETQAAKPLGITILTPYRKQILALRQKLQHVTCSTVDAFQGRESDVIIFSSVRSNAEGDIGFLEDARRLNVMWTRARLALIIVGDRRTLNSSELWKRAIESCTEVKMEEKALA